MAHADHEEVFAAYLAAEARGEGGDFEALCREHAAIAPELRALYADWRRVQGVLARIGATQTLSQRIEALLGVDDPEISLDEDGDPGPARGADEAGRPSRTGTLRSGPSAERIERLALYSAPESRYAKRGEIGRGGMGAIFKVWDQDLRRPLAMKVILGGKDFLGAGEKVRIEPHRLTRFLEEAQITSQLDHPGIVPVHELGVDVHGRAYFTMRLVRGRSFAAVIDYVHHPELAAEDGVEPWTLARALGVLLRVAEAMAYAHSKQVVHRDLKPSNVMVGRFGESYVMDWGLAKVHGRPDNRNIRIRGDESRGSQSDVRTDRLAEQSQPGSESPIVTMDGDVVGTPAYMSPEQARGRVDEVDEQSDVYGLGALLYHLVSGVRPYVPPGERVTPYRVLERLRQGPPTAIHALRPEVPPELVAICERAMARRKSERYADMQAFASDLRAFLEGRVVAAYERGALAELRKWVRRNRALAASIATTLIAVLAGLAAVSVVQAAGRREAERERNLAREARGLAEDARAHADRALAELAALSEVRHAKTLLEREYGELWPVFPERAVDYERWLAEARVIRERLPDYRAELERLRERAAPPTALDRELERSAKRALVDERDTLATRLAALAALLDGPAADVPTAPVAAWAEQVDALRAEITALDARIAERTIWRFAATGDGARHDLLAEAVAFGASLDARIANVAWRLATASTLAEASRDGPLARQRWRAVQQDLARDERFAGLELEPRLGLLPLARDPTSGLWEFAWLPSGAAPERDPEQGLWQLDAASAIVLVLVPPGSFRLGCDAPDGRTKRIGDPYVDPGCRAQFFESPSRALRLDAFFVSKFETTQAQWLRIQGDNPSQYAAERAADDDPTPYSLLHPVDSVAWDRAREFAARAGLELPSEARWEYAARAGTTSVFWWGDDPAGLVGRENVADLDLARLDPNYGREQGNVELLEDGHAYTAAVGSLEPNRFGLHDVAGNVHEWCREFDYQGGTSVRDGDGYREQPETPYRLVKGGSFSQRAQSARSAFHAGVPPAEAWESIGVRLVLSATP